MRCQPRYEGPVYIWLKNKQFCLLCDEAADDSSRPSAWPVKPSCPGWAITARPAPCRCHAAGLTCGQCLKQPPAFEQVIAPWTYSFPVDSLITRFKHSAKWPFGRLLAELLAQFLQHRFDEDLQRPDALVPVPLADQAPAPAGLQSGGDAGPLAGRRPGYTLRRTAAADEFRTPARNRT